MKVKAIDATIYHYGWARPPAFMQHKRKSLDTIHKGAEKAAALYRGQPEEFDYGPLRLAKKFTGTHPKVMQPWIEKFDWQDQLREDGPIPKNRGRFKHEIRKNRLLTMVEQNLFGGKTIMGFKNYELV